VLTNDDAATRASAPLRSVAAKIANDHRMQGAELAAIASNLGWEAPMVPNPTQQWIAQQLKAMPSGAAYDAAYLSAQIAAHQQAIELFEKESTWGRQWAVQSFAQRSLPMLRHHLHELTALRDGSTTSTTSTSSTTSTTTSMPPIATGS
jgi:putative membrane protein